jgi:hypothetical protein
MMMSYSIDYPEVERGCELRLQDLEGGRGLPICRSSRSQVRFRHQPEAAKPWAFAFTSVLIRQPASSIDSPASSRTVAPTI